MQVLYTRSKPNDDPAYRSLNKLLGEADIVATSRSRTRRAASWTLADWR